MEVDIAKKEPTKEEVLKLITALSDELEAN
jgi:hypothetical protein